MLIGSRTADDGVIRELRYYILPGRLGTKEQKVQLLALLKVFGKPPHLFNTLIGERVCRRHSLSKGFGRLEQWGDGVDADQKDQDHYPEQADKSDEIGRAACRERVSVLV